MTHKEAVALTQAGEVAITRNGGTWRGTVVGVITRPALVLEQEDGARVAITLDGAEVKS